MTGHSTLGGNMRTFLIFSSVFAIFAGGCGSRASENGDFSTASLSSASDAKSADGGYSKGGTSTYYTKDAGSTGSDSTSADASGGIAMGPADETGIGLKPGGAQDINYFRALLKNGTLPKPTDMTLEGWLNEHDTVLPPPQPDRAITLHAMGAVVQNAWPDGDLQSTTGEAVLQIGLNSGLKLADVKDSASLTVVVDHSGSMAGEKMADVHLGLHALIDAAPATTELAILGFSFSVETDLPPTLLTPEGRADAHAAVEKLLATGGTNIHDGLQEGIQLCQKAPEKFKFRHVLFLSDGQATEGDQDPEHIKKLASDAHANGCTVSTVGVGLDFDAPLMTAMGEQGGGTAWFMPDASHAKEIFIQDIETLMLPVADALTLKFAMAPGWKVKQIYGFDWVQKDDVVTITGPSKGEVPNPGDPTTQDPPPDNQPPVAMPTLFASKRNALIMARLQPPAETDFSKIVDLTLASVTYSYHLAKANKTETFTVPVQVPGLQQVADGGLAYFASPIVRRAWILLHVGLDLRYACALAASGTKSDAQQLLANRIAWFDKHFAQFSSEELQTVDASQPDMPDAKALMQSLATVIK